MVSVIWFRKGLRLHDNPAFESVIKKSIEIRPVFILDPWFVKNANVGINRWRFLQQSLEDINSRLQKMGSRLFVIRGKPEEVFPKIIKDWKVKHLSYEFDTEPYAKQRDSKITNLAFELGVKVESHTSHTLYEPDAIIMKNNGQPPLQYQKLCSIISSLGCPPKSLPKIKHLPLECQVADEKILDSSEFNVPSLKELGVEESELENCYYKGGETEGLKRLERYITESNGTWVRKFEKPKTSPNSLEPSTTVLSPYLKFGCVSPRLLYERLKEVYKKGGHSKPPVSLLGQLYWRELFYTCGHAIHNFDQMHGNRICKQIDWDVNPEYLSAWREGRTGYPYIDAIMTQLKKEGWIHHLARHSVACFLTRGDLYLSWEEGMKVFEEYLLDADWSLNAGNWMWLSASAFFHQYFRVYSPVAFGKKTDPHGNYIRKYLPQLKKFPVEYIYEPWTAPHSVQKAARCVIGEDYPKPIVDHSIISKINITRMKKAYVNNATECKASPIKRKTPNKTKASKVAKITDTFKKIE